MKVAVAIGLGLANNSAMNPPPSPHGHVDLSTIVDALRDQQGQLDPLDQEVLDALQSRGFITADQDDNLPPTLGQRVADRVASFGGSWTFIFLFSSIILVWMLLNLGLLWIRPFDPYPFILLNLVLSSLAAVQAPIIMMSQNRQADYDRQQAERDYQVNLKGEIEIRLLHAKMDAVLAKLSSPSNT